MVKLAKPVVVVANGNFPKHPVPLASLNTCGTLICTDGAARNCLDLGYQPDVIIGDMDSLDQKTVPAGIHQVQITSQADNDLEKLLRWCLEQSQDEATILGATGKRDAQHLANLKLAEHYIDRIRIRFITDYSILDCQTGECQYASFPGQIVSLIPVDPACRITTENLKFPLKHQSLVHPTEGISNTSTGNTFTIKSSHPVWVIREHRPLD